VAEPEEVYEPATSFKWVIITALIVWTIGGITIFFARY
jgi:hypothetical protein